MTKKTSEQYVEEIKQLHKAIKIYPEVNKLKSTIQSRVKSWSKLVQLNFYCANNEQKPYTTDEIGYMCLPMPRMNVSGHRQTSDYICYLPEYKLITGVFWERKEVSDWYSTIIHNRDRFYDECIRSQQDQDCDIMIIGVEGTNDRFIKYRPNQKSGATIQSRHALCEHLSPRFNYDVIIRWHNGRNASIKDMIEQNRMWIKYNYGKVLKL